MPHQLAPLRICVGLALAALEDILHPHLEPESQWDRFVRHNVSAGITRYMRTSKCTDSAAKAEIPPRRYNLHAEMASSINMRLEN